MAIVFSAFAAGNFPQPTICDRACWTARSPQCSMSQEPTFNRAVIHHTASSPDWSVTSLEDSILRVRAHQNYHMDSLGWCDIGYHFLTDKLGNNLEGRDGSIPSRPRGAHDGTNTCSIGVSMMGYLHDPYNNDPPSVMRNSVYDMIAWKCDDPFTGMGAGTYNNKQVGYLCGHLDVSATACPGDLMYYPYIGTDVNGGEARVEVYTRVTGSTPTPTPIPPDMYVNDIAMEAGKKGKNRYANATIWIKEEGGADVIGATVSGEWSDAVTSSSSGDTGSDGKVTLKSPNLKSAGTFTFCVTDVVASGLIYNPGMNVETCDSVYAP